MNKLSFENAISSRSKLAYPFLHLTSSRFFVGVGRCKPLALAVSWEKFSSMAPSGFVPSTIVRVFQADGFAERSRPVASNELRQRSQFGLSAVSPCFFSTGSRR